MALYFVAVSQSSIGGVTFSYCVSCQNGSAVLKCSGTELLYLGAKPSIYSPRIALLTYEFVKVGICGYFTLIVFPMSSGC